MTLLEFSKPKVLGSDFRREYDPLYAQANIALSNHFGIKVSEFEEKLYVRYFTSSPREVDDVIYSKLTCLAAWNSFNDAGVSQFVYCDNEILSEVENYYFKPKGSDKTKRFDRLAITVADKPRKNYWIRTI